MNHTLKIEELPSHTGNIFSAEHIPQHEHGNSSGYYNHSIGYYDHSLYDVSYNQYEYYNSEEYTIESIRILLGSRIISRDAYDKILYVLNFALDKSDPRHMYLEPILKSNETFKKDFEFIEESEMEL